jgi:hypothetical protein
LQNIDLFTGSLESVDMRIEEIENFLQENNGIVLKLLSKCFMMINNTSYISYDFFHKRLDLWQFAAV